MAAASTAEASAAPVATPAATPSATPVPAWVNYLVPDGRSANVVAVGTDGTVYVATYKIGQNTTRTDVQLMALGPDGKPRTGWAAPAIPADRIVTSAVAGPGGALYLALGPDFSSDATPAPPVTILRLDADGSTAPGWPVAIDTTGLGSNLELAGQDVVFTWSSKANQATIERIGPDGARAAGWPVQLATAAWLSPVAADGTLYVGEWTRTLANNGKPPTYQGAALAAYGADGQTLAGWHAPKIDAGRVPYGAPIASGVLAVEVVPGFQGGQAKLVWLNVDGTPAGPTAKGPSGGLDASVQVGPDGTPYVTYGSGGYRMSDGAIADAVPGYVVAYRPDGKAKPGWPARFQGWPQNGLDQLPGTISADGTFWVIERFNGTQARVHAYSPDGKALLAKPLVINGDAFTDGQVGPSGAFYVTDRTKGSTTVIEVRPGGS
jgi:hypothetical protein